jgi:hypothetical protein
MMRSPAVVLVAALATFALGCGGKQRTDTKAGLTARDIIDASSPAIVRIEAGDAKVGTGFVIGADGLVATNLQSSRASRTSASGSTRTRPSIPCR